MSRKLDIHSALPAAILVVALLAFGLATAGAAKQYSGGTAGSKPASDTMMKYLVISPHTPEQCLASLEAVSAGPKGDAELANWEWGCKGGDHTGYLIISAANADEALRHVPEMERGQARAIALNKFTMQDIKSLHAMKS